MRTRQELKMQAKSFFKSHNYWELVGLGLLLYFLEEGFVVYQQKDSFATASEKFVHYTVETYTLPYVNIIFPLLGIFVFLPLAYGVRKAFLYRVREEDSSDCIGDSFNSMWYTRNLAIIIVVGFKIWLGTMCLVIPGLVMYYKYYFVSYIAADHPEMSRSEVMQLCDRMTYGKKMELFIYNVSFAGWMLLSICTGGLVGIFYYLPYKYLTDTMLYEEFIANGYDPTRIY